MISFPQSNTTESNLNYQLLNSESSKLETNIIESPCGWNGVLSLEIFDNIPEDDLYQHWGEWGVCESVGSRRLRTRQCRAIAGINTHCETGKLIDSIHCSFGGGRNRTVSEDNITVYDIAYCDNDYSQGFNVFVYLFRF